MREKVHILVVDDEASIRQTLAVILKDEGYEVSTAENGLEALAQAKERFFDVAMIDVKLPGMSGLEVLRALKKVSSETIPVMITGYATIENCIKAIDEGAYAYITKPPSIDEIKVVIHRAIERKKTEEQFIQSEKLRALGQMAGGVAHDFNNILASILGNVQLIFRQKERLGMKEIERRLRSVEKSALDGARVVRHIQEFSLTEMGGKFASLDLNKVIKDAIQMTKPKWKDEAEEKGIPIRMVTKLRDIPLIAGDVSELREVLTNLIFNALDAMPRGGEITISTKLAAKKGASSEKPSFVEISVKDTGIGMSEEVKKRAFDPFFTTKGVKRTGMGLSISYGIIKRHKGKIDIKTEEGKGTTFILKLPLSLGIKPSSRPRVLTKKTKKARILVIDDEKSITEVLSELLTAEGHEVKLATTAREGLTILEKDGFDLVFTDLGMPEMSGWELAKRAKAISPQASVVLITGWGIQLDEMKMEKAGVDLVVNKPFTLDQVLSSVRKALQLKENRVRKKKKVA